MNKNTTARPDEQPKVVNNPLVPPDGPLASIQEAQRVLGEVYFKYQRRIGPFASQALKSIHSLPKAHADIAALVEAARPLTNALHDAGLLADLLNGLRPHERSSYESHLRALETALAPFGGAA